jgi:hypothetical protein
MSSLSAVGELHIDNEINYPPYTLFYRVLMGAQYFNFFL